MYHMKIPLLVFTKLDAAMLHVAKTTDRGPAHGPDLGEVWVNGGVVLSGTKVWVPGWASIDHGDGGAL